MGKNVPINCPRCGKTTFISMTEAEYRRYMKDEELVQRIFSNRTPNVRETLISGWCDKCQDEIFGLSEEYAS